MNNGEERKKKKKHFNWTFFFFNVRKKMISQTSVFHVWKRWQRPILKINNGFKISFSLICFETTNIIAGDISLAEGINYKLIQTK